jgi:hypothetical protein
VDNRTQWNTNERTQLMITVRVSTTVPEDRQITLKLPPEVPTGAVDLTVTVSSVDDLEFDHGTAPPTSLAEWAAKNAEHWGNRISSTDVEGFTGRRY